jgi:hypothetical protein
MATSAPTGLQAVKTITGAPWNGQTNPYYIQSGYANNIFKGDLVTLDTNGFIINMRDIAPNDGSTANTAGAGPIGVFNGCSFVTNTATNPIDPASPGRPYWPAGTVTLNGVPAIANIIDDPNVVFTIQTYAAGYQWSAINGTALVSWPLSGGNIVLGNFLTGQSQMVAAAPGILITSPLRILRFVPQDGNVPTPPSINPAIAQGLAIPYNTVEVLIQNHAYLSRPVGI